MKYEYDIIVGDEYVVSHETELELKHEKPFYNPDGKLLLVMYPSKELRDYLEDNETPAIAASYAEAFVIFEENATKLSPKLYVCANDMDGNIYDKEFSLSDESCKILQEVIENQVKRVGFESFAELQKDFVSFLDKENGVVKEESKEEAKEPLTKVSLRPAQQKDNSKDMGEER